MLNGRIKSKINKNKDRQQLNHITNVMKKRTQRFSDGGVVDHEVSAYSAQHWKHVQLTRNGDRFRGKMNVPSFALKFFAKSFVKESRIALFNT